MTDALPNPAHKNTCPSQERQTKSSKMYSSIHHIVRMKNIVMEPFNATCLAKHIPSVRLAHLKLYLSSNAAASGRDRHAHFVRVFRGWYRFNDK